MRAGGSNRRPFLTCQTARQYRRSICVVARPQPVHGWNSLSMTASGPLLPIRTKRVSGDERMCATRPRCSISGGVCPKAWCLHRPRRGGVRSAGRRLARADLARSLRRNAVGDLVVDHIGHVVRRSDRNPDGPRPALAGLGRAGRLAREIERDRRPQGEGPPQTSTWTRLTLSIPICTGMHGSARNCTDLHAKPSSQR